ncbi:MAG TPA: hypothetical protein VGB26_13515 [Nitrospiria bacterium]|jgi:hypothetical protein
MRLIFVSSLLFLYFSQPLFIHAEEPISLEVLFDGVSVQYGGWVLTVTLMANSEIAEIQLTVEKSEGLEVTAGKPFWEGALPLGREHVFEISMSLVKPPPQTLTVGIQGRTENGRQFKK